LAKFGHQGLAVLGVRVIGSRTGYLFRAIDPAWIREASMSPKTTLKPQRRQEMEIIMGDHHE